MSSFKADHVSVAGLVKVRRSVTAPRRMCGTRQTHVRDRQADKTIYLERIPGKKKVYLRLACHTRCPEHGRRTAIACRTTASGYVLTVQPSILSICPPHSTSLRRVDGSSTDQILPYECFGPTHQHINFACREHASGNDSAKHAYCPAFPIW